MNREEPNTVDVIDVAPDDGAGADTGDAERRAVSGGAGGVQAAAFAIALAALLAAGATAWFGLRQLDTLAAGIQSLEGGLAAVRGEQAALHASLGEATTALREHGAELGTQRSAMEATRASFRQQERLLEQETGRMQAREDELSAAVADLRRRVGRSGAHWVVAEAGYLLRVADYRARLAGDVGSARVALETADQRLRDTGDPGWSAVRAQIARDIATLDAFAAPDRAGIAARIAALIDASDGLPLAPSVAGPTTVATDPEAEVPRDRGLDTLLDDLSAGFRDAVRIRRHDTPVQALLAPGQRLFVRQNLALRLEAARLALLQRDQATYSNTLAEASVWLARYFDPANAAVQRMRRSLDELAALQVAESVPDVGASLRAFEARGGPADDGGGARAP